MMYVSTTERMSFLADNPPVQELHVCDSQLFSAIRSHMRALFVAIYSPEGDARQNEPALALRMEMMKWLTSPLIPNTDLLLSFGLVNELHTRHRWGEYAVREVMALKDLISRYREEGSVLNKEFVQVFCNLTVEFGQDRLKIWCHRNERDLYRALLDGLTVLEDHAFICSLAEYRSCPPADALIRFGPLRTHGMAKTPEALITSPAYRRLVRFVWKGLTDEEQFAADPLVPEHNWLTTMRSVRHSVTDSARVGASPLVEEPADDIVFFAGTKVADRGMHRCVLVELPGDWGVLLRPGTSQLIFAPLRNDCDAIAYRHIIDVEEGDYLLIHDADADFGEISVDAAKAPLAALWKKALADLYKRQSGLCVQKMKDAGISLRHLHRAAESWMSLNGSVIHAPQRRDHFQALLTCVIDPELIPARSHNGQAVPGWRLAWAEVAASRSTAVEHGVMESAIVNEQLIVELRNELGHLRDMVSPDGGYHHLLTPESGLAGSVRFDPVISIASGFAAPQEEFGKPMKLFVAEQYRYESGDAL
jgi:hypothetical protein